MLYTITQFADQVKIRLTLQLIKGISRALQKLLQYFNGNIISTLFISSSSSILPAISYLELNESVALAPLKSTIAPSLFTAAMSLQYSHNLPGVFE